MVVLINFENLGFYNRDSRALVTCKVKILRESIAWFPWRVTVQKLWRLFASWGFT